MEIERKFLVRSLPSDLDTCAFHMIEQGYLCTDPVVRVRREDDSFYMTYKGKGFLAREEYNLPLTKEAYDHLIQKADGNIITKKRCMIPIEGTSLTIELDIFEGKFAGTVIAEVEFDSIEEAESFIPPDWFGADVTKDRRYSNSFMSSQHFDTV